MLVHLTMTAGTNMSNQLMYKIVTLKHVLLKLVTTESVATLSFKVGSPKISICTVISLLEKSRASCTSK